MNLRKLAMALVFFWPTVVHAGELSDPKGCASQMVELIQPGCRAS